MKYKVIYTESAKKDLKDIFEYISKKLLAPGNATGKTQRIMAAVRKLILCHVGTNFMKKNRGTVKNFDIFRLIIIWYFTK